MRFRPFVYRLRRGSEGWLAILILSAVVLVNHYGGFAVADSWLLDSQFRVLRAVRPEVADSRVVVIAIDEATLKASHTPLALWHPYYGRLFDWLATAKPRAVGFDIVLPARGYEQRFPNTDHALMRGLQALRKADIAVTVAHSIDENLRPKPLYGPFLSLVDPRYGIGSDVLRLDADRVIRRHTEFLGTGGSAVPTFAGQLVRAVGGHYAPGLLNYRIVQAIPVISAATLVEDSPQRRRIQASLKDKIVIIGSVLSDIDRLALPLPLSPTASSFRQPGVLVQANFVSALLNRSLIREPTRWPMLALLASTLLIWPLTTSVLRASVVLAVLVIGVYGLTLGVLMSGAYLPSAAAITSALLLTGTRLLIRTYQAQKAILIARTRVEAQKDFVSAVSHDLRTPVGALLSTIDLVKKAKDDHTRARYLAWLGRAASVLGHEVDELLELSKIEDKAYRPAETPFDLYALVTEMYTSALPLAAAKGLRLTLAVSAAVAPMRQGAETAIMRLLQNVLSNALKYSKQGRIFLRVSPGANPQTVRFEIEDEGGGIPQDKISHLFDKYQRFNNDMPGVGLGMAIVRKLVDSLNGTLRLDSREGQGTAIHMTLPLKQDDTSRGEYAPSLPPVVATTGEPRVLRTLDALGVSLNSPTPVQPAVMIVDADSAASSVPTIRVICDRALRETVRDSVWCFGQGAEVPRTVSGVTLRRLLYLASLDDGYTYQPQTGAVAIEAQGDRPQRRVLLVDDNEIVRLAWSEILIRAGYNVTAVVCGAEAIEQVQKTPFDILILDQNLPDIMGTALAQAIRQLDDVAPRLPILLVTSTSMTEAPVEPTAITRQLPKTTAPDELIALMARLLEPNTVTPGSRASTRHETRKNNEG